MAFEVPGAVSADRYARGEVVDQSANRFMRGVYAWMTGGLLVTAATAVGVLAIPAVLQAVGQFFMPIVIAELVLVVAFSFVAHKVSAPVAAAMFLGYAFLTGLTFSLLFLVYQLGSVVGAFLTTSLMFGALSVYATVTKRDLSAWGTFLFMGLIGVIIASVVNLFLQSGMLSFVVSAASVVVFAGLTAYDTQKLRSLHAQGYGEGTGTLAIRGALVLYLDFINLFLALLRLFGRRR